MKPNFQPIAKSMLSNSKFAMGYSRWSEQHGRYESWDEAVERVMNMHREKYGHVMTAELEEYIQFAEQAYKDKAVLGSQRALQFGGPQIFQHEARMYNCLGEESSFVTIDGLRNFRDFRDGDVTTVLTHNGNWKRAVVRCYGDDVLNTITLVKGRTERTVRATSDHRWILKDGKEVTDLRVGDNLFKEPQVFAEFDYETATVEERLYWAYGFVYGDGTLNNGHSLVRLCGDKRHFEERFTDLGFKTSSSLSLRGDSIVYTGKYQKELPDPSVDSPELIRAFVAGYLDADGNRNNNVSGKKFTGIQTSSQEAAEFIREVFPIAGVHVISEKDLSGEATNFGKRDFCVSFTTCDSSGSKFNAGWKVGSIDLGVDKEPRLEEHTSELQSQP